MSYRYWVIGRRVVLVLGVLVLAYRSYGDRLAFFFQRPDAVRDIELTHTEFRAEVGDRPAWFIGVRNKSGTFAYAQIEMEASYFDNAGKMIESDRFVVRQKLTPGDEQLVSSYDTKPRGAAVRGTLRVVGAQVLQ